MIIAVSSVKAKAGLSTSRQRSLEGISSKGKRRLKQNEGKSLSCLDKCCEIHLKPAQTDAKEFVCL